MAVARAKGQGATNLHPVGQSSAVVATAKVLRDEILRRGPDDLFLGSEDDLVLRLGVSQPTFRQAARLLEYEELLVVRRGLGGGYFGRRPSADGVARMAGLYLYSQGVSYRELARAQLAIESELIAMVVNEVKAEQRQLLAAYVDSHPDLNDPTDMPRAVRAINGLWRLASEVAGNSVINLFVLSSHAYSAYSPSLSLTPDRVRIYVKGLRRMCDAILEGDADAAIALRKANYLKTIEWSELDQHPGEAG
ncbi:MAG: FCD domain-containing protein [Sphingobium sp.]